MTPDEYMFNVISKYRSAINQQSPSYIVAGSLSNVIRTWAGEYLLDIYFSGSYAKGTAIKGTTDIDLFISLHPDTPRTLKEIYESLFSYFSNRKYVLRKQNVSLGCTLPAVKIDLIPAKKQAGNTDNHSLYKNKEQTWTQTNINKHIDLVRRSGCVPEIIATNIWRNINRLEFPSFYLELCVLTALSGKPINQYASNFLSVLDYLRDKLLSARIIDPANTNNIISDDLTVIEKLNIASAAKDSRAQSNWGKIIW